MNDKQIDTVVKVAQGIIAICAAVFVVLIILTITQTI